MEKPHKKSHIIKIWIVGGILISILASILLPSEVIPLIISLIFTSLIFYVIYLILNKVFIYLKSFKFLNMEIVEILKYPSVLLKRRYEKKELKRLNKEREKEEEKIEKFKILEKQAETKNSNTGLEFFVNNKYKENIITFFPSLSNSKKFWIIIFIILIFLSGYGMGKNSNKKLTPQEIMKERANCYRWYGKEACDDPNFNPN